MSAREYVVKIRGDQYVVVGPDGRIVGRPHPRSTRPVYGFMTRRAAEKWIADQIEKEEGR